MSGYERARDGRCWLCGRDGRDDPLDWHHIFGSAADRDKSEKYGLKIRLCHNRCHIYGEFAAHNNASTMKALKHYGQKKAMIELGWDVEDFRHEFGKNYLDDEELEEIARIQEEGRYAAGAL